jgi:class 3 adenylate cyclase/tetratricopeptide (TPR) repeat protein
MTYQPRPIPTQEVNLPDSLRAITEQLAESTHDVWARQRLAEGWRYGPTRDDATKHHPCLVAYADLPESEKEYDRNTAMETLRAILTLGYDISPRVAGQPETEVATGPHNDGPADVLRILGDRTLDLGAVLAIWRTPHEDRKSWSREPEVYRRLGERVLKLGEPLLAYDVVCEGLEVFPGDARLRQLEGLALARSDSPERANLILERLYAEGQDDEETVGILARTHKSLGLGDQHCHPRKVLTHLRRALELYSEAYRRFGGYWTGINAATLAVLLDNDDLAKPLAVRVREQCLSELERAHSNGEDAYWPLATLGEATLVLGRVAEAGDWYSQAAEIAIREGRYGDLTTTRQQARRLLNRLETDGAILDRCFRVPRVAVFTGHMIDRPGRVSPRFPPELEGAVRMAIRDQLERSGVRIGYASAACGSDLLFLEEILELGGEAHVVLPYDRNQFLADSVEILPGSTWGERCRRVLERAEVTTASQQRLAIGGVSYDYANMMLHGLATLRAEQVDTELVAVAVWDGRPGDGPGGTASTVSRWRAQAVAVEVIDLTALLQRESPDLAARQIAVSAVRDEPAADSGLHFGSQVVSIMFGDVVGFSKLTEPQVPRFVEHFLGLIAELLASGPFLPLKKNTWGDGLYLAFEGPLETGRFALELLARVHATRWQDVGLPASLDLRIGLHAGPVYLCSDPVTEQTNCIGTHVSHAARIEPITPAGQVFASQAFAALAAAERVHEFACHYVGQTPLAKGHGIYPTYHVHRRE